MKYKILNLGLVVTSLVGHLEWGGGNRMFLFQAEADVFSRLFTDFGSVVHPLVLMPMIGQALLVFSLFQKSPNKALTLIGVLGIGSLLVVMLGIGVIVSDLKMVLSTLPFLLLSWVTLQQYFMNKSLQENKGEYYANKNKI